MLVKTRVSGCLACGGKIKHKMASGGKAKIRIKPENRGKFTSWCKRNGYGGVNSKCISAGKNSSSASVRKMATFAANARSWKKEDGGKLIMVANSF